jgi:hypothetical protein
MRLVGYALLVLGLVILLVREMHFVQWGIDLAFMQGEASAEKLTYTKEEVYEARRMAAVATAKQATGAVPYGLLIAIGGVLLDAASRRTMSKTKIAELGTSPNGCPAAPVSNSAATEGPPSVS